MQPASFPGSPEETNEAVAPAAAGERPGPAPVCAAKRQRLQPGVWSPLDPPDEVNPMFAAAGKVFQTSNMSTPGSSSDDEQAMDLLVRLWSPSSNGPDEQELFMNHMHPSTGTSPSTTSPTPDDLANVVMPPIAETTMPVNLKQLPVAHAYPLPAHLQPGAHMRPGWPAPPPAGTYGEPSSSRPRDPRDAFLEQRYRPRAQCMPPPGYYMAPRPLQLAPGAPRRSAPPQVGGGEMPVAQSQVAAPSHQHLAELTRPLEMAASPAHARMAPPPPNGGRFSRGAAHQPAYTAPPPAAAHVPRPAARPSVQWHSLIAEQPQPERKRKASETPETEPRAAPAAAPTPAPAPPACMPMSHGGARPVEWVMSGGALPADAVSQILAPPANPAQSGRSRHPSPLPTRPDMAPEAPLASARHEMISEAPLAIAHPHDALAPQPHAPGPAAAPSFDMNMNFTSLAPASRGYGTSGGARALCNMTTMSTLGGGSGRNLAERKEWAVSEDRQICKSVRRHGFKWRLVAADVPGRSDDAVRNRYNRIKDLPYVQPNEEELALEASEGISGDIKPSPRRRSIKAGAEAKAKKVAKETSDYSSKDSASSHGSDEEKEKVERVSWSRTEDELIVRSVNEVRRAPSRRHRPPPSLASSCHTTAPTNTPPRSPGLASACILLSHPACILHAIFARSRACPPTPLLSSATSGPRLPSGSPDGPSTPSATAMRGCSRLRCAVIRSSSPQDRACPSASSSSPHPSKWGGCRLGHDERSSATACRRLGRGVSPRAVRIDAYTEAL